VTGADSKQATQAEYVFWQLGTYVKMEDIGSIIHQHP
jgi:hypothetical protein